MEKKKKALLIGVSSLVLLTVAVATVAIFCNIFDIKLVTIDGKGYIESNVTYNSLISDINNTKIILKYPNKNYEYTYKDLGVVVSFDDEQKEYIKNKFVIDLNKLNPDFDTTKIKDILSSINDDKNEHEYASIEKTESGFEVTKEIKGNAINIDKLSAYITENIDGAEMNIDLTEFYKEFDNSKPTYEDLINEVLKVDNTFIEYKNGFKVSLIDYIDCLDFNGKTIEINEETLNSHKSEIDKAIEKGLIEYDTVGDPVKFTTHSGKEIKVSGGTWGNFFDSDKETEYVIDKFKNFESETDRKPIYSQEMKDDIGDTYIEVSISEQHVWHYVKGKLCCESDCVTGTLDGKHNTPTGVYFICERQNGRTLRPSGSSSGTWVNKWMRITWSGVGLHDAYWRRAFGGSIYKYSGSHGCVNLPKDYAYKLYDETYMNMPVVVY